MTRYSWSRIQTFDKCRYQYYLRYKEKLETLSNQDADNALVLGHALHTGIELGPEAGLQEYYNQFYIVTDLVENEAIKLDYWIRRVRELLPNGKHEERICTETYLGFADYLVPNDDGTYDLYDFKYSNNDYSKSGQLSVYNHYLDKEIKRMYYVMIPKIKIRQKKTETLEMFRNRLRNELKKKDVEFVRVKYNPDAVIDYLDSCIAADKCESYPKNPTRLCNWCEFQDYCEKGDEYMLLPKNERRKIGENKSKKFWIYGAPMSGKTTFCDKMPDPIELNTDGNIKYVTMPYLSIKDEVVYEGRVENRTYAWQIFKDAIKELEKKDNDFKTIVVDLVEDVYEACRVCKCHELGISHESDDSFRAYDKVRSEFLNVMKGLLNLPYDNIVLLSHEDMSKDLTRRSGDKVTAIKPAINDKIANKLAGLVDITARIVVENGKRHLEFKSDEVQFGGGRLRELRITECELDWDALCAIYDDAIERMQNKIAPKPEPAKAEPTPTPQEEPQEAPKEETTTTTTKKRRVRE